MLDQCKVDMCVSRFCVATTLTTGHGRKSVSILFNNLCRMLKVSHLRTTAYHPCPNGLVDDFARQLKDSLRAYTAAATGTEALLSLMHGLRTDYMPDLTRTTTEILYETTLGLPGDCFCTSDAAPGLDPADYFSRLRNLLQRIYPCRTRAQPSCKTIAAP